MTQCSTAKSLPPPVGVNRWRSSPASEQWPGNSALPRSNRKSILVPDETSARVREAIVRTATQAGRTAEASREARDGRQFRGGDSTDRTEARGDTAADLFQPLG